MAALAWRAVVIVLCVCFSASTHNSKDDLHAVLNALEKLVKYYQDNHMYLNLDGLFGLRVIEGQLHLIISEHEAGKHQHLSLDVIKKIRDLQMAAHNASNIGLESVRSDDAKYFEDFRPLVSTSWKILKPKRKLEASLRWEIPQYKAKTKVKLKEEVSDQCMTELMRKDGHNCVVSETCSEIMTTRGLTGYGITHQLLWSILAEIMPNCSQSVKEVLAQNHMGDISKFQLELCTNNFYEMVAVVQVLMHGRVHESHQDLFLEQQFVCPSLGFYEFMKKDYLDQILSWQFTSGCFGERDSQQNQEEELDVALLLKGYHDDSRKHVLEVNKLEQLDSAVKNMKVEVENERSDNTNFNSRTSSFNQNSFQAMPPLNQNQVLQGNVLKVPSHVIIHKGSKPILNQTVLSKLINQKVDSVKSNSELARAKKSDHIFPSEEYNKYGIQKEILDSEHPDSNGFHSKLKSNILPMGSDYPKYRLDKGPKGNEGHGKRSLLIWRGSVDSSDIVSRLKRNVDGRRILVEKDMHGGCLSHKTGVGSGALVMYLRYLIDPGNISWTGQHELFLSDSRNFLQTAGENKVLNERDEVVQENKEEEEEEEEEVDDDEDEAINGALNEDVNYNDGNDAEAGDDQGDDDFSEEQALNGEDGTGEDLHKIVSNHDGDALIINEEAQKETEMYADNNKKIVPDTQKKLVDVEDDDDTDQEEDHNYYDDEGETERGIIKRRKPPTSRPHPPFKTRRKHSDKLLSNGPIYGQGPGVILVPDHPNYTVILFVSVAPFFILFLFLFKFIRKRRVHIRYYF